MKYKVIDSSRAEEVAQLAVCLLNEIIERTGLEHFDIDDEKIVSLCESYVSNNLYIVMAAFDGDKIVGFGAICESHSLYAEGGFGIIQELYILPEYRSKAVGKGLIGNIVELAKTKNWKRLELCTPPVPEFDRTVDFYQSNGFEITGGYKMKCSLS